MTHHHALKAVSDLDLGPVKVKLMHQQSGEGWDLATANVVEAEYKRFLHLMKEFPEELIAPTKAVDTFWHYHILDTMKYAADCEAAFGYFLHHNPNVGLGEDDAQQQRGAERMGQLYESVFAEPYPGAAPAYCTRAAASDAAYCTRAPQAGAAYCTRAGSSVAAYCTRVGVSSSGAYCTRAALVPSSAYCTRALATESHAQ